MTVALMWEAKAAEGRGPELLAWARDRAPEHRAPEHQYLEGEPLRREHFSAPGGRVLVITWWDGAYDDELPELPDPAPELIARPVHRWRFEQVP